MHIISRKPFNDAARKYPNNAGAIEALYKTLRNGFFETPDALRELFPSLDNFKYKDKWWVIDYEQALELMDQLIEEYDKYVPLIEMLSASIERWEDEADEFAQFNQRVEALDDGAAVLGTLMDQYQLKADDLREEIGGSSLVSMILNGSRKLTRDHIQALSDRFHLSPSVFFSRA